MSQPGVESKPYAQAFFEGVEGFVTDPRNQHLKLPEDSSTSETDIGIRRRNLGLLDLPDNLAQIAKVIYGVSRGRNGYHFYPHKTTEFQDVVPTTIVARMEEDPETQTRKALVRVQRDNIVPGYLYSFYALDFVSDGAKMELNRRLNCEPGIWFHGRGGNRRVNTEEKIDLGMLSSYNSPFVLASKEALYLLEIYSDMERPKTGLLARIRGIGSK